MTFIVFISTGQAITNFFLYFDKGYEGVNRTVKMHLLERHAMEWMQRYGIGWGSKGIHSIFNMTSCLGAGQSSKSSKHNARTRYAGSQKAAAKATKKVTFTLSRLFYTSNRHLVNPYSRCLV